jgi:hypothetical protein
MQTVVLAGTGPHITIRLANPEIASKVTVLANDKTKTVSLKEKNDFKFAA